VALAPGIDPNALQITVDKGVLVIFGDRQKSFSEDTENTSLNAQARCFTAR